MKSIAALFAVLLAHYGSELFADTANGVAWAFYINRGIEGVVLCVLLLPVFQAMKGWQKTVGVFAVLLGIFEEGQTSVCGIAGMGLEVPLWSTLCVERFGAMIYLALAALALTLMVKGITKNEARDRSPSG